MTLILLLQDASLLTNCHLHFEYIAYTILQINNTGLPILKPAKTIFFKARYMNCIAIGVLFTKCNIANFLYATSFNQVYTILSPTTKHFT